MINVKQFFTREKLPLIFILITAFLLRIYNLSFQSFWLDEIHTARESSMPLKELLQFLKCCDVHPPLFYLMEKLVIQLFGCNEFTLRFPSVIASTAGVWAVYLLGKEMHSKGLGIIVATLTCFNLFHIQYAQDARPYAFVFLFVCLSFLFLIRFIRFPSLKQGLLFAVFALLSLYVHYFGVFVLFAQMLIAGVFWILEKENKRKYFINFLISSLVILAGFSFQIPSLLGISKVTSFWIEPTPDSVLIDLFRQFFANSNLLMPFVVLFLIGGLLFLFRKSSDVENAEKAEHFSFPGIIILMWICFTLMVPLIRSLLVVPMIIPRYFISVLPAVLLIIAYGLISIKSTILRSVVLTLFCLFSLIDISVVKAYYTRVTKAEFRKLASFINQYPSYPLVAPVTSWHQHYYLRKFGYTDSIMGGSFEDFAKKAIDDTGSLKGFWFADAHGGAKPSEDIVNKLSGHYNMVLSTDLFDAWSMLFLNKQGANKDYLLLRHNDIEGVPKFMDDKDTLIVLWDNAPVSKQVFLNKGQYSVRIMCKGDAAAGEYPHLNLSIDNQIFATFYTQKQKDNYDFNFEIKQDTLYKFIARMDNDSTIVASHEDRNAFIYSILVLKKQPE